MESKAQRREPPYLIRTVPTGGDFVGGLSVALVLVPQSIAYATIAGLPPQVGLFAATLPLIFAAPLVSCPWLQTGPVALTSLLTLGALQSVQPPGCESLSEAQLIGAASLLAFIVGACRLLMGLFRLGGYTRLLSRPVVLGFTTAAAVLIISSQLGAALGTNHKDVNVLIRAIRSVSSLDWSVWAIGTAIGTALVVHFTRKIHKLFPAILVAVIAAILFSKLSGYDGEVVGDLDGRFVSLRLDLPWQQLGVLLIPGIIIALVGFAEPASISLTLMEQEQMKWNPSRELCGGGLANMVSGLIGGYPVGGSLSRSTINKFAGAETAWSGLITGGIMLLALQLTPFLSDLPKATVGAIIIMAVLRLVQLGAIYDLLKRKRLHGILSITTMIATLATAPRVERGILIGVVLGMIAKLVDRKTKSSEAQAPL